MNTFFVLKALLPLEKQLVLQVLLQYFSSDSCSVETWVLIKQSFVTPAPGQCNAVTWQQGKNWGQYVMHCSCISCLPKIPFQVWWGPAEASRYVGGVNLKNGWMSKNTAQCTLRQVYSLYLQVMQALLMLSKQQTNKQTNKKLLFLFPSSFLLYRLCLYRNLPFLQACLSLSLLACGISSKYSACAINKYRSIKQHSDDQKAFGWLGFCGFVLFFFF